MRYYADSNFWEHIPAGQIFWAMKHEQLLLLYKAAKHYTDYWERIEAFQNDPECRKPMVHLKISIFNAIFDFWECASKIIFWGTVNTIMWTTGVPLEIASLLGEFVIEKKLERHCVGVTTATCTGEENEELRKLACLHIVRTDIVHLHIIIEIKNNTRTTMIISYICISHKSMIDI